MCLSLFLASLLTLVQLNCENLFDCRHDSLKQDTEFTPDGDRRWTDRKYWDKLNNTAKAIISCGAHENGDWRVPDLVALCEVENDSVMRDLAKRSLLRNSNYEYIVTSSPDERALGRGSAILSRAASRPVRHYPLRILPGERHAPHERTSSTPLDAYHNGRHAPHIRGTRPRAVTAESGDKTPPQARGRPPCGGHRLLAISMPRPDEIHIAGDFNDGGDSQAVRQICAKGLYDASAHAKGGHGSKAGTYKYKEDGEHRPHQ